jgi:D-alanyl-D-alanine carboxypeptidase
MRRRTILSAAAVTAVACAARPSAAAAGTRPVPQARLLAALREVAATDPNIPGVAVAVRAPGLRWAGAIGSVTLGGGAALTTAYGFRLASVTKLFTAATVLLLAERGRLRVDQPVARYLDPTLVDRLSVIDGVRYGREITIGMLLNHTSGVYDYSTDPAYRAAVLADPARRWTAAEQIELALTLGQPYFPPGRGFHYADTEYVLAGQVVQQATGAPLHAVMRELIIDPLCLGDTYTESLEPPAPAPRAHQYYGTLDTYGFDPSFDLYGGGGLVSTVDDLARFWDTVVHGRLFRAPATLALMITPSRYGNFGMGPFHVLVDGTEAIGHSGFGGASVVYLPARRQLIAATTNQDNGFAELPAERVTAVLRR